MGEKEYILRESAIEAYESASISADRIRAIPAADVVERKKGHYIGDFDGYADGYPVYDIWSCSECGWVFEGWDEEPTYNYCPNCGADMQKEKKHGPARAGNLAGPHRVTSFEKRGPN